MALEKDKQAFPLFNERVDTGLGRSRQNPVVAREQCVLPELVPARMRDPYSGRQTGAYRVSGSAGAFEDSRQLLGHLVARNAIEMESGSMGGETRPDGRDGAFGCPLEQLHERLPIGLIAQTLCPRLGSGNNQGVGSIGEQLIDAAVGSAHLLPRLPAARDVC